MRWLLIAFLLMVCSCRSTTYRYMLETTAVSDKGQVTVREIWSTESKKRPEGWGESPAIKLSKELR